VPEEREKVRAHDKAVVGERRRRDPEAFRGKERAKYARRVARDKEGFMASRRAQAQRRKERAEGALDGVGFEKDLPATSRPDGTKSFRWS
jgi:hypothetical protein